MSKIRFYLSIVLFTIVSTASAAGQKGSIRGTVIDAETGEPLVGTAVYIEGTSLGVATDLEGSFTISNITPGKCSIIAYYLGYELFKQVVTVEAGQELAIPIPLRSEGIDIGEVVVVARINRESESALLSGQKESLPATQSIGAVEMSRKGIGDAQAAVAQVSGISKQEGVKNVFVRGLGDRYNATLLNGFPLPSEDPEYKNIALDFFGSDVIRNIDVHKVFDTAVNGDAGGAVIDINTKELVGGSAFSISADAGLNTEAVGAHFLRNQDGVSYFGASNDTRPTPGQFDFANSLDPSTVKLPLNHSYGISGGKLWNLGKRGNPLTFFAVASHSTGYSFTKETVRNADTADNIYQDQTGEKSTIDISQLVSANINYRMKERLSLAYNFMLIHANEQYVGDYTGKDPRYGDAYDQMSGFMRRQQSNDNLLLTHQFISQWNFHSRWRLNAGVAYNSMRGTEPDRRENNLSLQSDGLYTFTGSNRQRRFFSELNESDLNIKASVSYKLKGGVDIERSNITLGYRGRMVEDDFEAVEYSYGGFRSGSRHYPLDVKLDDIYNNGNSFHGRERDTPVGKFYMPSKVLEDSYTVDKYIHSAYAEATHRFSGHFAGSLGFQTDYIDMTVNHKSKERNIEKIYYLPSINLRYDLTDEHSLRLAASQSYTLPQSKEISDYLYVNIGFASQGNMDIKPSDNYNLDLKWDWYVSNSELISLGAFYKRITNPIGRIDQGNSAGLLTYDNISDKADVAGVELEIRKNIFTSTSASGSFRGNRLTAGLNASCIYSALDLAIPNTPHRITQLEGAAPFIVNGDLSYNFTSGDRIFTASAVAGWFSKRIHTLGSQGYNDIIEEGVIQLSVVASFKVNKFMTLKMKAGNLLNSPYRLTRQLATTDDKIVLNEYRKGIDFSFGIGFDL